MAGLLNALFGLVCGQAAAHTWSPGGILLPFCERCTGLYAGTAVALALHLALRVRPDVRFLQVHGGFLLVMIPLGYHWVPQDALVRTLSGVLFGAGLVGFLWVMPGPRVTATHALGRAQGLLYTAGLISGLAFIPALAARGGQGAWYALVCLAVAGLGGLGILTLANVGLASIWLVSAPFTPRRSVADDLE